MTPDTQRLATWLSTSLLLFAVGCEAEPEPLTQWWANAGASGAHPITGSSGSSAQPTPTPTPSVSGVWAILAKDMDGTVVEFEANGTSTGCQAGWPDPKFPDPRYVEEFCGPVSRVQDADHIAFDLPLTGFGGLHYGFDGTVSAGGERMAGVHHIISGNPPYDAVQPGAVIRYERDNSRGFPVGEDWPAAALDAWRRAPLSVTTETQQGPFAAGQRYELIETWHGVTGDLGEFLRSELSFDTPADGSLTVHAGPVPKTLADRPVRLAIRFQNMALAEVEVEMPSGGIFLLKP